MANILLQTTIVDIPDDWNVGRFSLLADELARAGHEVTARNRDEATDDSVLSVLDTLDYDQLWLMAVDTGHGLSPGDSAGIMRFRERGGGVLTARDHQDLGSCLVCLGSIGQLNHFHNQNPEPHARRDDQDNPNISWPNYHSGANGEYQPVMADEPAHELLRTDRNPSGRIEWFPAHPHEGAVSAPPEYDFAQVVGRGRSTVSGRTFNLAVALDGETMADGGPAGRAVACSTFHHFADMNWDIDAGAPSFVTEPPSDEMKRDPSRLEVFKDYVRNIARWLGTTALRGPVPGGPGHESIGYRGWAVNDRLSHSSKPCRRRAWPNRALQDEPLLVGTTARRSLEDLRRFGGVVVLADDDLAVVAGTSVDDPGRLGDLNLSIV